MNKGLITWVVCASPLDFPGQFVGRKFVGVSATLEYFADVELLKVREWIRQEAAKMGWEPIKMNRHPYDERQIYEIWL